MKIYYLYPEIRVPDDLSLVVIIYHCLSNIGALFEPQLRKALIINNFNILHRQVNLHTNDKMIYHRLSQSAHFERFFCSWR